jgi:hypothetical protein
MNPPRRATRAPHPAPSPRRRRPLPGLARPTPGAPLRSARPPSSFELRALRPLAAGEEALITYGDAKPNAELLRDYGGRPARSHGWRGAAAAGAEARAAVAFQRPAAS